MCNIELKIKSKFHLNIIIIFYTFLNAFTWRIKNRIHIAGGIREWKLRVTDKNEKTCYNFSVQYCARATLGRTF